MSKDITSGIIDAERDFSHYPDMNLYSGLGRQAKAIVLQKQPSVFTDYAKEDDESTGQPSAIVQSRERVEIWSLPREDSEGYNSTF